jgi:hypothetical protein
MPTEQKPKEINWEYKKSALMERHETFRTLGISFAIVAVLCSIIWAITIYNLEAVKHPVDYNRKVEAETSVKRN